MYCSFITANASCKVSKTLSAQMTSIRRWRRRSDNSDASVWTRTPRIHDPEVGLMDRCSGVLGVFLRHPNFGPAGYEIGHAFEFDSEIRRVICVSTAFRFGVEPIVFKTVHRANSGAKAS